jgi:hypothetical protein
MSNNNIFIHTWLTNPISMKNNSNNCSKGAAGECINLKLKIYSSEICLPLWYLCKIKYYNGIVQRNKGLHRKG